jgi:hypothetical protein
LGLLQALSGQIRRYRENLTFMQKLVPARLHVQIE